MNFIKNSVLLKELSESKEISFFTLHSHSAFFVSELYPPKSQLDSHNDKLL